MDKKLVNGYIVTTMIRLGYNGEDILKMIQAFQKTINEIDKKQVEKIYNDPYKWRFAYKFNAEKAKFLISLQKSLQK